MKLTILGSSDFRLDFPQGSAGYVVEAGQTTIKLDFGRGNIVNLAAAGIDWKNIDAILISHLHPDHIGDLFQYLQTYAYSHFEGSLDRKMTLYGPRGFPTYFDQFRRLVITEWGHIPESKEVYDEQWTIGDVSVRVLPMKHTIDAVGYRLESGGRSLCYTGDTEFNEQLITLARGVDVLLTECSASTQPIEGHLSPTDVARIAKEAGVRKVVLTHYPGDENAREERKQAVAAAYDGEVIACHDTQTIEW